MWKPSIGGRTLTRSVMMPNIVCEDPSNNIKNIRRWGTSGGDRRCSVWQRICSSVDLFRRKFKNGEFLCCVRLWKQRRQKQKPFCRIPAVIKHQGEWKLQMSTSRRDKWTRFVSLHCSFYYRSAQNVNYPSASGGIARAKYLGISV